MVKGVFRLQVGCKGLSVGMCTCPLLLLGSLCLCEFHSCAIMLGTARTAKYDAILVPLWRMRQRVQCKDVQRHFSGTGARAHTARSGCRCHLRAVPGRSSTASLRVPKSGAHPAARRVVTPARHRCCAWAPVMRRARPPPPAPSWSSARQTQCRAPGEC